MGFEIPNEAEASFRDQAEPDSVDFRILRDAIAGTGYVSGLDITSDNSDMTSVVTNGVISVDGVTYTITGGTLTHATADPDFARFDLIVSDTAGAVYILTGTPTTSLLVSPEFPVPDDGVVVLWSVRVGATVTEITSDDVLDKRTNVFNCCDTDNEWRSYLNGIHNLGYTSEKLITFANATELIVPNGWPKVQGLTAGQPVITNGLVYIGDFDGNMNAYPEPGSLAVGWTTFLDGHGNSNGSGITGTCAVADVFIPGDAATTSMLFVGAGGDDTSAPAQLFALNALTGEIIWQVALGDVPGSFIFSSPRVFRDYVYVGISSLDDSPLTQGLIVKLVAATGDEVTRFKAVPDGDSGATIWSSVAIDEANSALYVTTGNEGSGDQSKALSMVRTDLDLNYVSHWKIKGDSLPTDSDFGASPTLFKGTAWSVTGRTFNGTTDYYSETVDLSGQSKVTLSFWLLQDSFTDDSQRTVFDYGGDSDDRLLLFPTWDSPNDFLILRGVVASPTFAAFPRPTASAWHHYVIVVPTAADPSAWVDGVAQTLTRNDGNPGGTYASGVTTGLMVTALTRWFNAGKLSRFAVWNGSVTLTGTQISLLAAGTDPREVQSSGLKFEFAPYSGTRSLVGAVNKNGIFYVFDRDDIDTGPVNRVRVANGTSEGQSGNIAPAAYDGRSLYVGGGETTINAVSHAGSIRAYNPDNFDVPLWQVGLLSPVVGAVTVTGDIVLVTAGNVLYFLNAATGDVITSYDVGTLIYSAASVSSGVVYLGDTSGNVNAWSSKNLVGSSTVSGPLSSLDLPNILLYEPEDDALNPSDSYLWLDPSGPILHVKYKAPDGTVYSYEIGTLT